MEYKIVKASIEHARYLADNLQRSDVKELEYSEGKDPYEAIVEGIKRSDDCCVTLEEGLPILIFGVRGMSVTSRVGSIWMLSTRLSPTARKLLLINSKAFIDRMISHYTKVFNYVWVGNKSAIKWLRWVGFDIHPPAPHGIAGKDFHYFEMVK